MPESMIGTKEKSVCFAKAIDWQDWLSVTALTTAGGVRRHGHGPELAGGDPPSWQGTCWHSGLFLNQRKKHI